MEESDHDLLARYLASGDEAAFEALVRRHSGMVLGLCQRILKDTEGAEDALQAVFLTLMQKAGTLKGEGSLAGWLHRVAFNIARDARRRRQLREIREREASEMARSTDSSAKDWPKLSAWLDQELDALPEKLRAPLILHHLEGHDYGHIARQLGCSSGTVASRLNRARERLRARLTKRGVNLSAMLLLTLLTKHAVAAPAAEALVASLGKTAALFAAGKPVAACGAAPYALQLSQSAIKGIFIAKVKLASAVVLGAGLLAASGAALHTRLRPEPAAVAIKDPAIAQRADGDSGPPNPSEPLVVDGLSIALKPARPAFSDNDPLTFQVTLQNTTREPFKLYGLRMENVLLNYVDVKDKENWGAVRPDNSSEKFEDLALALAPGEAHSFTVSFLSRENVKTENVSLFRWNEQESLDEQHAMRPAPGKYRVSLSVEFENQMDTAGQWKPQAWKNRAIKSGPQEIRFSGKETVNGDF